MHTPHPTRAYGHVWWLIPAALAAIAVAGATGTLPLPGGAL